MNGLWWRVRVREGPVPVGLRKVKKKETTKNLAGGCFFSFSCCPKTHVRAFLAVCKNNSKKSKS
jgi:hypothetical protein